MQEFDISVTGNDESEYDGAYVRCVLFRLDTENYGVNVQNIREVLRVGEIRAVPGAPSDVLGVINVRGVIVSVLDARQFFKLPSTAHTDLSRIIIIEQQGQTLGLLVDEVKEVRDIPEERIDAIGSVTDESTNRMIQGVTHAMGNDVIIIIDSVKFFTDAPAAGNFISACTLDDDLF